MPPGHVTWVPTPYMDAHSAGILLAFALTASTVISLLPLAAYSTWLALRAACRKVRIMRARELPVVEDIPMRRGIYIPPDPIAQHADRLSACVGPTYRYPVITDAEWATAVHLFNADYDAWRRTS